MFKMLPTRERRNENNASVRLQELESTVAAIGKSQAVIEFNMDGTIISANPNFLNAMGYTLAEVQGKHHSMFVEPGYQNSPEYQKFWAALNRGEYQAAEYRRIAKGGRDIWIQASYNPLLDQNGKPYKVTKFATDITKQKLQNADYAGQIAAISKSQAVIEFNMDGIITNANENFLNAMGYTLAEVQGKHHGMFVEPTYRTSEEYRQFWASLNRGEYQSAEYKRFGKGGKEVWIQASYNPIFDQNSKPFKVVKYATDVSNVYAARTSLKITIQSLAAGAEEMNSSIKEISSQMVKSKDTALQAFDYVVETDRNTQKLADASKQMTGIVDLIGTVAGQINLLALNATIEAARAGEAGKGFAVVASEVKSLANQAKAATDKISAEINAMQTLTNVVTGSLGAIKQSIESVREYATSTSAAVEEQSVVVSEMSASMQRASTEADRIG